MTRNPFCVDRLYKVLGATEWRPEAAVVAGASDDARDGFIHLSTAAQLPGTLQRHFRGRSDLLLLEIDAGLLGAALKWEPARDGALFPHLYAPLPLAAVRSVCAIAAWSDVARELPL